MRVHAPPGGASQMGTAFGWENNAPRSENTRPSTAQSARTENLAAPGQTVGYAPGGIEVCAESSLAPENGRCLARCGS